MDGDRVVAVFVAHKEFASRDADHGHTAGLSDFFGSILRWFALLSAEPPDLLPATAMRNAEKQDKSGSVGGLVGRAMIA